MGRSKSGGHESRCSQRWFGRGVTQRRQPRARTNQDFGIGRVFGETPTKVVRRHTFRPEMVRHHSDHTEQSRIAGMISIELQEKLQRMLQLAGIGKSRCLFQPGIQFSRGFLGFYVQLTPFAGRHCRGRNSPTSA